MRPFTVVTTVTCLIVVHGPDCVRGDETSDFHLAIAKGEIDKVKQALAKDAGAANRRNEHDFTPLFQAAVPGRTAVAKLLLDHGAKVDATVLGETPLFRAAFQGNTETVALLLDRGASIEATNKEGATPLCTAIRRSHGDTVRLLLDRGADVNPKADDLKQTHPIDKKYWIPLLEAVSQAGIALHGKMRSEMKGEKARAARQEQLLKEGEAIAKMLMNHKKTDLNVKHPTRGHAALHLAALQGQVAIAKLLLETGAEVNIRTNRPLHESRRVPPHDETPLHLAVRAGHEEVAKRLLKNGADRNARNSRGETPFDLEKPKSKRGEGR